MADDKLESCNSMKQIKVAHGIVVGRSRVTMAPAILLVSNESERGKSRAIGG